MTLGVCVNRGVNFARWHAVRIDHERDTAAQIIAAARAYGVAV